VSTDEVLAAMGEGVGSRVEEHSTIESGLDVTSVACHNALSLPLFGRGRRGAHATPKRLTRPMSVTRVTSIQGIVIPFLAEAGGLGQDLVL
jgi:hypothetical protein